MSHVTTHLMPKIRPSFERRPARVVGTPVARAILRLAAVRPTARFQLNDRPGPSFTPSPLHIETGVFSHRPEVSEPSARFQPAVNAACPLATAAAMSACEPIFAPTRNAGSFAQSAAGHASIPIKTSRPIN
jgi:hypothetical protein